MNLLNCYMEKNSMNTITLDARRMVERDEAQDYLRCQLELPEYYGGNLDALHDCLTEFSEMEIIIEMNGAESFYLNRLIHVFEDSAEDNATLKLNIV